MLVNVSHHHYSGREASGFLDVLWSLCDMKAKSMERTTNIYYNRDDPEKHYTTFKKPDAKYHIMHDFVYM